MKGYLAPEGLAVDLAGTPLERFASPAGGGAPAGGDAPAREGAPAGGDAPARVAIVLGSGLSPLVRVIAAEATIAYSAVPRYPLEDAQPAAHPAGHAGELVLGRLGDVPVAVFSGRVHLYQGVDARGAAWPARVAAGLGCETLIVTNASGAVSPHVRPGQLALITDHLNLMGGNPLAGWIGANDSGPFIPMRNAYDPELCARARTVAAAEEIDLADAVYAAVPGPSYETPAEVAALRVMGADIVGMSTVPEVIAARALGMRVLGLSLVTNVAAGAALSHDAVLAAGEDVADDLARLVIAILRVIPDARAS